MRLQDLEARLNYNPTAYVGIYFWLRASIESWIKVKKLSER